jgi:hypothetical protein
MVPIDSILPPSSLFFHEIKGKIVQTSQKNTPDIRGSDSSDLSDDSKLKPFLDSLEHLATKKDDILKGLRIHNKSAIISFYRQ